VHTSSKLLLSLILTEEEEEEEEIHVARNVSRINIFITSF
jgi:hypothetical protein